MINPWYLGAIALGALAAFCAYYGAAIDAKRETAEQTSRIETKLQAVGTQIQSLRTDPTTTQNSTALLALDEEYKGLAEEFFRAVPLRTAQEEARTAKQRVDEIQRTQELETYFNSVRKETERLVEAYNRTAGRDAIKLSGRDVPKNLFDPKSLHPAYLLLQFESGEYWANRIVFYPNRTMALQLVRLNDPSVSHNYDSMALTNDSINLVISGETFGVSLNSAISDAVKANVIGEIPNDTLPLGGLVKFAVDLNRRAIEYELLLTADPKR